MSTRVQYLIPLTFKGITIGFGWSTEPIEFPTELPVQLGSNSFQASWTEYFSTKLNRQVKYGYIELPPQFYRPDSATVTGILNVSVLSDEEPRLPWQTFACGTYGAPERAGKSLFTKFLEGWDFTPIVAGETSSYLDPLETTLEIDSQAFFDNPGIIFFDYNWFTGVYVSLSAQIPNVKNVSLYERGNSQPAVSGFILRDVNSDSGLPNVLRFVKTTVEPLVAGSVAEFNLVLDNGTESRTVVIRLLES